MEERERERERESERGGDGGQFNIPSTLIYARSLFPYLVLIKSLSLLALWYFIHFTPLDTRVLFIHFTPLDHAFCFSPKKDHKHRPDI